MNIVQQPNAMPSFMPAVPMPHLYTPPVETKKIVVENYDKFKIKN
jgi:hypothetical protein